MCLRRLIAGLLTLLLGGTAVALHASSDVKPAEFTIKWNIAPRDSVIEQDFVVRAYRVYRFEIKFTSAREPDGVRPSTEELQRLRTFAGDNSYSLVTKSSATSDHPEVVIPTARTRAEARQWYDSLAKGDYAYKAANPGVMVPLQIRIEQVASDGTTTLQTERLVETENSIGPFTGGLLRLIIEIKLKPGTYRVRARTIKETSLPSDMETFLRLARL